MKKVIAIITLTAWSQCYSQVLIPGFHARITGEELSYHAPQPDAPVSLLVRSEDSTSWIEWESAMIAETGYSKLESGSNKSGTWNLEPGTFLMLAGIDVNPENPHSWKVFVNDRPMFTISSPLDTNKKTITWPGPEGSCLVFKTKEVDKYGDFMGYLYCNLPASMLEAGNPVRFKVVGESAGSRTWFMVFEYETIDQVRMIPEQAVMKGEKGNYQVLRAEIVRYADPVDAKITIAGKKLSHSLNFGYNVLYLPVPQIEQETSFDLLVKAGKQIIADTSFAIQPVKPRTIYLLHHSHNDIGYTHIQPEVEQMQWHNLDRALALGDSTKDFPAGAGLKWCSEVMWAVETWYDQASPEKKQAIRDAVKSGRIELNGLFANELTSLCSPEELDRLLEAGRRISKECGTELNSAMITDIPGWTWGLVTALANSGVKYLSLGTNRGHRIGDIIEAWGDKPFYWVSPSGEEKVFCWIHGEGYSLFHTGLAYSAIRKRLQEDLVFGYMNRLAATNYPYEEVMLRYNIGSDNGPVDETLPLAVKEWNEKYVTPKVVISTVGEAFSLFEKKHGDEIPRVAGDLTCYWEDGAYSTTRETIQNRHNASRLTQAEALWAIHNPAGYPEADFHEAWRNVLLYDEHTWGSWNSISEPESPFTIRQWEIKKSFAEAADKQSRKLFFNAMTSKAMGGPASDAVEVINTCGWPRSGLVTFSAKANPESIRLQDSAGNDVPVQVLSDGNIAFIATSVPGLGSKIYKVLIPDSGFRIPDSKTQNKNSNNSNIQDPIAQSSNLETARFTLTIDPVTGAIASLVWKPGETPSHSGETPSQEYEMESHGGHLEKPDGVSLKNINLVDTSLYSGLNEYIYVDGRNPDNHLKSKLIGITKIENGLLVTSYDLQLESPGCSSHLVTIKIIDALDLVEITNNLVKNKVYTPEAVHIAFPFNIPGGKMKYDLSYGQCRPEKDQLPGSNKNFIALEHWVDVAGKAGGVTVLCPDIPLFEVAKPTMDEIVYGWIDSLPPSQTFVSYVMNNYWETNYAASQEGECTFSYVISPYQANNPAIAEQEAIGCRQPLITRKGGGWMKEKQSLVRFMNQNLIITSIKPADKGDAYLVAVYNAGLKEEIPKLQNPVKMMLTDPDGIAEKPLKKLDSIPPSGVRYYKIFPEQ